MIACTTGFCKWTCYHEFSILNVSEMDGLSKYGGSGDFQLKMAKEGSYVVWNVTVDNPRMMELLGIFVGEKTMKLVQSLDPNNLVQMTIRDHFTPVFESYLRLRNTNGSADWQKLAEQAGLTKDNITFIETTITTNRDALIRSEYDCVAGQCEILDASPSYL